MIFIAVIFVGYRILAMMRTDSSGPTISGGQDQLEVSIHDGDDVIPLMNEIRAAVDEAETVTSAEYWPYPSYGDLLFGVK